MTDSETLSEAAAPRAALTHAEPGSYPRAMNHPAPASTAVLLAAGLGTRMKSRHPKAMHRIAGRTMLLDDVATDVRWPAFTQLAATRDVGSVLSVPLPVQRHVLGALNLYSHRAGAFDAAAVELSETFAGYAAVALANAQLHESATRMAQQMKDAMASRAVIEQAKGIIMASRHCTPDEAFAILRTTSQNTNSKLRQLAEALVSDVANRRT